MRLWALYVEYAKPQDIQRLGLRYLNRIDIPPQITNLDYYLKRPPEGIPELPGVLAGFLHVDTFRAQDYPFVVNVTRTVQATQSADIPAGLIIDIEVSTMNPAVYQEGWIEARLNEMRWFKNQAFFSNIAESVKEKFK